MDAWHLIWCSILERFNRDATLMSRRKVKACLRYIYRYPGTPVVLTQMRGSGQTFDL